MLSNCLSNKKKLGGLLDEKVTFYLHKTLPDAISYDIIMLFNPTHSQDVGLAAVGALSEFNAKSFWQSLFLTLDDV